MTDCLSLNFHLFIFEFEFIYLHTHTYISGYKSKIACNRLQFGTDIGDRNSMVRWLLEQTHQKSQFDTDGPDILAPSPSRCKTNGAECCLRYHEFVDALLDTTKKNLAIEKKNRALLEKNKSKRFAYKPISINLHFAPQNRKCRFDMIAYDEIHKLEELDAESFSVLDGKLGNGSGLPLANRTVMIPLHLHASLSQTNKTSAESVNTDSESLIDNEIKAEAEIILEKLLLVFDDDYHTLGHIYNHEINHDKYITEIMTILSLEKRFLPQDFLP